MKSFRFRNFRDVRSCELRTALGPDSATSVAVGASWQAGALRPTLGDAFDELRRLLGGASCAVVARNATKDASMHFGCVVSSGSAEVNYELFLEQGRVGFEQLSTVRRGKERHLLRRMPDAWDSHPSLGAAISPPKAGVAWLASLASGDEALKIRSDLLSMLAAGPPELLGALEVKAQPELRQQLEEYHVSTLFNAVESHMQQHPAIIKLEARDFDEPEPTIWAAAGPTENPAWQQVPLVFDWYGPHR